VYFAESPNVVVFNYLLILGGGGVVGIQIQEKGQVVRGCTKE